VSIQLSLLSCTVTTIPTALQIFYLQCVKVFRNYCIVIARKMLTYILCNPSEVIQTHFAELSSIATANCSTQRFATFSDMLNKDIFMILDSVGMPLTAGFLRKPECSWYCQALQVVLSSH